MSGSRSSSVLAPKESPHGSGINPLSACRCQPGACGDVEHPHRKAEYFRTLNPSIPAAVGIPSTRRPASNLCIDSFEPPSTGCCSSSSPFRLFTGTPPRRINHLLFSLWPSLNFSSDSRIGTKTSTIPSELIGRRKCSSAVGCRVRRFGDSRNPSPTRIAASNSWCQPFTAPWIRKTSMTFMTPSRPFPKSFECTIESRP